MPYIKYQASARKDFGLDEVCRCVGANTSEGELNFILTSIIVAWLAPQQNYAAFNAAVGVLECCKLELYRRMVAPYEDRKRKENGDVY